MSPHDSTPCVGPDASGVEVVEQLQQPILGPHHGRVVVAQIPGHGRHRLGQVVKEIGAVVHVVGSHLVAPLGPIHDHTIGHREMFEGVHHTRHP